MEAKEMVASLVEKSRIAQKQLEKFNQQQIDAIVRAIAKVVYDNAEPPSHIASRSVIARQIWSTRSCQYPISCSNSPAVRRIASVSTTIFAIF